MPISKKIKDLVSIGIGDLVATVIIGLFWFYLAAELGPKLFGEITYLISIAQVISVIALLGAGNMLVVYIAKNIKINSTIFLMTLIVGGISSILIFFIIQDLGVSFLILGLVVFGIASSELTGKKLFQKNAKLLILHRIFMVGFSLGLYFLIGPSGVIIGYALSFFPYVPRIIHGFRENKVNFVLIKERTHFLYASYGQSLIGALSNNTLDKILIGPIFGFILLGNYSLGVQFFGLITILPGIIIQYLIPQDASGIENNKLKKITVFGSICFAVLGFTIGSEFISFFFVQFTEASDIMRIMSIAVVPHTIAFLYQSKFLGAEKSKRFLISTTVRLVTHIIFLIILGFWWGGIGIASSFVIGSSAGAIFSYIIDKKNWLR